jgi:hypothetical protein
LSHSPYRYFVDIAVTTAIALSTKLGLFWLPAARDTIATQITYRSLDIIFMAALILLLLLALLPGAPAQAGETIERGLQQLLLLHRLVRHSQVVQCSKLIPPRLNSIQRQRQSVR